MFFLQLNAIFFLKLVKLKCITSNAFSSFAFGTFCRLSLSRSLVLVYTLCATNARHRLYSGSQFWERKKMSKLVSELKKCHQKRSKTHK